MKPENDRQLRYLSRRDFIKMAGVCAVAGLAGCTPISKVITELTETPTSTSTITATPFPTATETPSATSTPDIAVILQAEIAKSGGTYRLSTTEDGRYWIEALQKKLKAPGEATSPDDEQVWLQALELVPLEEAKFAVRDYYVWDESGNVKTENVTINPQQFKMTWNTRFREMIATDQAGHEYFYQRELGTWISTEPRTGWPKDIRGTPNVFDGEGFKARGYSAIEEQFKVLLKEEWALFNDLYSAYLQTTITMFGYPYDLFDQSGLYTTLINFYNDHDQSKPQATRVKEMKFPALSISKLESSDDHVGYIVSIPARFWLSRTKDYLDNPPNILHILIDMNATLGSDKFDKNITDAEGMVNFYGRLFVWENWDQERAQYVANKGFYWTRFCFDAWVKKYPEGGTITTLQKLTLGRTLGLNVPESEREKLASGLETALLPADVLYANPYD